MKIQNELKDLTLSAEKYDHICHSRAPVGRGRREPIPYSEKNFPHFINGLVGSYVDRFNYISIIVASDFMFSSLENL